MKLKNGFMIRNIMDEFVVVPVGERITDFNGIITLNESGVLLWKYLEENSADVKDLAELLMNEYEVDEATAMEDVLRFVKVLEVQKLIEEQ